MRYLEIGGTRPWFSVTKDDEQVDEHLVVDYDHELPSANWYPDPTGIDGVRYWDGTGWTPQVRISHTYSHETDHLLHLVLTLLTCGWWIPVWLFLACVENPVRTGFAPAIYSPLPSGPGR